jgi:putative oxidoreductase
MQRLFSTFANGWPGIGLLLQRVVTAAALLHCAVAQIRTTTEFASIAPQMIAAAAGLFVLIGLWTPVVGTVVTIAELWVVFSGGGDPWMAAILATLGASLSAIGPGASSIDARLFGRKHIETSTW